MKRLKLVIPDVASLKGALLEDSPEGGVFVAGEHAVGVAEPLGV